VSLPADYVLWCRAHDLNPWHPDEWPAAGREAFQAWKRELAAARWVERMKSGLWDLLSPERQAEIIEEDVDWAEAPPPSRPYRGCPCHQFGNPGPAADLRLPENLLSAAEVIVWVGKDPLQRAGLTPKVAGCLAWLELAFSRPSR
jgi:hypothetical protein